MKPTIALRSFLFGGTLLAATPMLHAATLYWDGTDTTANADGGSGTWNNTAGNTNWDTLATAGVNSIWTNGAHSAVFGGTAGTVTLGTGVTVGGTSPVAIAFNTSGYIVGGTQNLTFNVASEINLNGTTFQSGVTFLSTSSNKALTINTGGTSSIAGKINTGSGAVTIGGNATLTLSSTSSTYTGQTIIGDNTGSSLLLKVTKLANLSQASSLGAPTTAANGVITIGDISRTSTLELVGGSSASITNRQVRVGGNHNGSGSATILNNNTDPLHSLTFTNAAFNLSNATTGSTRTLTLGGSNAGNNEIQGAIINNANNVGVTVNGSGAWKLSGDNTYDNVTTVAGTATLTLSGNNSGATGGVTLSTATTVNSPRLNVNSATALGGGTLNFGGGLATDTVRLDNTSTGLVSVSTNNVFTLNRNFTFIGTQSLDLGNMTTTLGGMSSGSSRNITVTANTLTFGGSIGEAALNLGVSKFGAGTLVFNSANTYSGTTTINNNGGTLRINDAGTLGSGAVTVSTSGTNTGTLELALTGTNNITNTFNGFASANSLATGGNAQIRNTSGTNTISSDLTVTSTGGAGLNVESNGGLLTLSGTITHTIASGRTLSLGGSGDGVVSGAIINNITGDVGLALNKSGTGTWTLTNNSNSYTGATTISDGTLQLGNATSTGNLSGTSSITVTGATSTLAVNRSNEFSQAVDLNNKVITGTGGFTQSGGGTTTLSLANSYTGTTTVNAGTLAVGVGGSGSITSNVTVNSGGTLGGSGTITGTVTVKSGGTHNAGNSPGIQTISGNVSYESGSIFAWDLASNSIGTRGTDYDGVTVTSGDLTVTSGAVFRVIQNAGVDFGNTFWDTNQTWADIFSVSGTLTGWANNTAVAVYNTSNVLQEVSSYGSFTINGASLTWTAVPEPTTALAGLLIAAGLLRRRRCA